MSDEFMAELDSLSSRATHDSILRGDAFKRYKHLTDITLYRWASCKSSTQALEVAQNRLELEAVNKLYWVLSEMLYDIDVIRHQQLIPLRRQLTNLQQIIAEMTPTDTQYSGIQDEIAHVTQQITVVEQQVADKQSIIDMNKPVYIHRLSVLYYTYYSSHHEYIAQRDAELSRRAAEDKVTIRQMKLDWRLHWKNLEVYGCRFSCQPRCSVHMPMFRNKSGT